MTRAQARRMQNDAFMEGDYRFPNLYEAEEIQIEVEIDPSPLGAIVFWSMAMVVIGCMVVAWVS